MTHKALVEHLQEEMKMGHKEGLYHQTILSLPLIPTGSKAVGYLRIRPGTFDISNMFCSTNIAFEAGF
ncbi:hypothetical protein [Gorillibacterium timonense]|uniref:hypothetical protein n=1 Tax=Gorillibacterium timonense TaxID=1689269 RepID=UPI00071DD41E|nr:hypothetical protein [Gorillibacterium timonense]